MVPSNIINDWLTFRCCRCRRSDSSIMDSTIIIIDGSACCRRSRSSDSPFMGPLIFTIDKSELRGSGMDPIINFKKGLT